MFIKHHDEPRNHHLDVISQLKICLVFNVWEILWAQRAIKHVEFKSKIFFTGAEFTRRADVTFYPGNQRLSIVQTATGLDNQNYLSVDTHLDGSVPFIPPGSTVQMEPFKDTYQYYPSCKSFSAWEARISIFA